MSEYLEFQRYGRDKSTIVDSNYISSGEFRKKDILAREINSFEEEQILYSKSINRAITGKRNVLAMHTHPCSMPPSIADFNSVYEHNYLLGIVVCHNSKIFCYKSSESITQTMYNLYVADYYKTVNDEYEAQILALNEMMETYDISYWEVK